MLNATYNLTRLCREHRQGSHETQAARIDTVNAFVKTLDGAGFSRDIRKRDYRLKESHVDRAVKAWRREGLSDRTMANRLAHLRSFAKWQGTPGLLRTNGEYLPDREPRAYPTPETNPAVAPGRYDPSDTRTQYAEASLRLMQAFPLRRAEACKIQPWRSTDTHLVLHRTACKGGRARDIRIRTDAQREALAFAREVAEGGSLIPPGLKYGGKRSWQDEFRREARRAGLPDGACHGTRYHYAQERYARLTRELSGGDGWVCPAAGGPYRDTMDDEDKRVDAQARQVVAEELGHGRARIASDYLGGLSAPKGD